VRGAFEVGWERRDEELEDAAENLGGEVEER